MAYFVFDGSSQPLLGCSGGVYCLVGILATKEFTLAMEWVISNSNLLHFCEWFSWFWPCCCICKDIPTSTGARPCSICTSTGASLSTMLLNWRADRVVLIKYWPSRFVIKNPIIEIIDYLQRAPLAFWGRFLQILRLLAILLIAGIFQKSKSSLFWIPLRMWVCFCSLAPILPCG